MARIFNQFRKRFVNKGQVKKYLLYATGEIVLVVIGILIALSINNIQHDKVMRRTELKVYQNIKNQVIEDREVLEEVMDYNNTYIALFGYAINIISTKDRSLIDTLARIAPNIFKYSDFNKGTHIYQNLVNSGDIKLLKNDAIISALQGLEEHYIHINRLEENHFKIILQFGDRGIVNNVNFSTGEVERPNEIYSFQFQNLLMGFLDIMNEKNEIYHRAYSKIKMIDSLTTYELQ